jgi:hypothetical protein
VKLARQSVTLVALTSPVVLGWILYGAAAWLIGHDSINYRIQDRGFGFITNAAETIFALGPVTSVVAALVFALPSILAYLRGIGSVSQAVALNTSAAIVFLCGLGCVGFLFALASTIASLLWIRALVWVATRESNNHLQPIPR